MTDDAGLSSHYVSERPIQVVLVCGVFGNVHDDDAHATITALGSLTATGGSVLWTRHRRPPDLVPMIRRWFEEAGFDETRTELEHTAPDAISAAACQVAGMVGAAAIVSYTTSGATALRAARERPAAPILVLTAKLATARRLAVLWGAHCVHTSDVRNFADMVQKAARIAHREGFAEPGQRVVVTAGVPFGTPGATNVLRIAWVDR